MSKIEPNQHVNSACSSEFTERAKMLVDSFVEASQFASVVTTSDGPAILIGGEVIALKSSAPALHVDALVKVLRGQSVPNAGYPRATNPETGEAVMFDGTRWVPVQ